VSLFSCLSTLKSHNCVKALLRRVNELHKEKREAVKQLRAEHEGRVNSLLSQINELDLENKVLKDQLSKALKPVEELSTALASKKQGQPLMSLDPKAPPIQNASREESDSALKGQKMLKNTCNYCSKSSHKFYDCKMRQRDLSLSKAAESIQTTGKGFIKLGISQNTDEQVLVRLMPGRLMLVVSNEPNSPSSTLSLYSLNGFLVLSQTLDYHVSDMTGLIDTIFTIDNKKKMRTYDLAMNLRSQTPCSSEGQIVSLCTTQKNLFLTLLVSGLVLRVIAFNREATQINQIIMKFEQQLTYSPRKVRVSEDDRVIYCRCQAQQSMFYVTPFDNPSAVGHFCLDKGPVDYDLGANGHLFVFVKNESCINEYDYSGRLFKSLSFGARLPSFLFDLEMASLFDFVITDLREKTAYLYCFEGRDCGYTLETRVTIPNELLGVPVGLVCSINEIKAESGADMALIWNPFAESSRVLTIAGSRSQVDRARGLLQTRLRRDGLDLDLETGLVSKQLLLLDLLS
jgi:hypothetical protein